MNTPGEHDACHLTPIKPITALIILSCIPSSHQCLQQCCISCCWPWSRPVAFLSDLCQKCLWKMSRDLHFLIQLPAPFQSKGMKLKG